MPKLLYMDLPNLRSKKTNLNNDEKIDHYPCLSPIQSTGRDPLFRGINARKENHWKPKDFERSELYSHSPCLFRRDGERERTRPPGDGQTSQARNKGPSE